MFTKELHMYLILDYGTKEAPKDPPDMKMLGTGRTWEFVDVAKRDGIKIAVYALDNCLLDWS